MALVGGLLLASGSAVLAAPSAPQFTITADRAAAVPVGHRWAFNDFFPRTATIETGGTFQFTNEGFHTATLLPLSWSEAADNDVNGIASADADDTARNRERHDEGDGEHPCCPPRPGAGLRHRRCPVRV